MSVVTEIRRTVSEATPVMAVVGATDLAVERVRKVAHDAGSFPSEFETRVSKLQVEVEKAVGSIDPAYLQKFFSKTFDPKNLQANAQQVPALAIARALEVAGKVETGYERLAERGKNLVLRVEDAKATKDLVRQGKATLSRSKAAMTTAQKAVVQTAEEAKATLSIGRKDVKDVAAEVEQVVTTGTKGTRAAIKRTAATARTRSTATKAAAKGAVTSAAKSVDAATAAAKDAAEKVGD
jgi:hypothetical protein